MTVLEAIRKRRSVREYDARPVPEDAMARMREALQMAPSACNNQPWSFVIVTGEKIRAALVSASRGQAFVGEAPVVIVGIGYPEKAYHRMGGSGNSIDIDLAIAIDHLTLAAVEEGLGTCWIGAFDEAAVKEILHVPAGAKVVALTPLGYPKHPSVIESGKPSRKPADEVFVDDQF